MLRVQGCESSGAMTKGSAVQMTKGLSSQQRQPVLSKRGCLSTGGRSAWSLPPPALVQEIPGTERCWVITWNMCHRLGPELETKTYQTLTGVAD